MHSTFSRATLFLLLVFEPIGPFMNLDAEAISDELDGMWKTLHKLFRTFSSFAGPQLVAKTYELKVEQFKAYLPVLKTISNRGIKERHWQQVTRKHFYS